MCAAAAAELGCEPDEVLVCSTGLIGIPLPIDKIESAASALASARSVDGGADAARAILTTDTHAKEVARPQRRASPSAAWPRARRCSPPTWRRCSPCSPPTPPSSPSRSAALLRQAVAQSFNTLSVDGCTVDQRHRDRARQRRRRSRRRRRARRCALTPACTDLAEPDGRRRRGRDQGRAGRRSSARRATRRRPRGARKVAESQLCKCSWYGQDPYWGRIVSELGSAGIDFDPDTRLRSPTAASSCADGGIAVDHDEASACASTWPSAAPRDRRRPRPRHRHRRRSSPTTSPTPTSTRTWGRRDRAGHGRQGGDPRRGAAVHPALPRQGRRRQVRRQRHGRRRLGEDDELALFAQDVVLMRSRRHAARRRPRRRAADRRAHGAARQGARVPATACGSPTPRPSTSPAWCSSAR